MTTYCYSDLEGGPVWEREFPIGTAPETIEVQGVVLSRDLHAEHPRATRAADPWVEHYSMSMGARTERHKQQIAKKLTAAGLPANFDKMDRLHVPSRKKQEEMAKVVLGPNAYNRQGY